MPSTKRRTRHCGGHVGTFEEGFADVERAADSVDGALRGAGGIAKRLRKAAQDGNIGTIRRETERLLGELTAVQQAVGNAKDAWPFGPEQEREYLDHGFTDEIQNVAAAHGLDVFVIDGRVVAHPSILSTLAGDRSVRINRQKSQAIRPQSVVARLKALQTKPPRFNTQQFLEAHYNAYLDLADRETTNRLKLGKSGEVIVLKRLYNLMTGLPGARRDYTELDFARDVHALVTSGQWTTRSGSTASFPVSTATKSGKDVIRYIDQRGQEVPYYGIQFSGG